MEFLKTLFSNSENNSLTYEQLESACKNSSIKLVNLSDGAYVSKQKYDDEIKAKNTSIESLQTTIKTRDKDLEDVKEQLLKAGTDSSKLTDVTNQLATLQTKYDNDIKEYQNRLSKQSYEFAVKEFASTKKFTSNAAKRDFISSMINKNLNLENGKIIGADDFIKIYTENNADAFINEEKVEQPVTKKSPHFVEPTSSVAKHDDSGFKFNFIGVRPHN